MLDQLRLQYQDAWNRAAHMDERISIVKRRGAVVPWHWEVRFIKAQQETARLAHEINKFLATSNITE